MVFPAGRGYGESYPWGLTVTNLPAVRIHRQPNGKLHAAHCLLQYSKPESAESAIARVTAGKTAFVSPADVHGVLDALELAGFEVVK